MRTKSKRMRRMKHDRLKQVRTVDYTSTIFNPTQTDASRGLGESRVEIVAP